MQRQHTEVSGLPSQPLVTAVPPPLSSSGVSTVAELTASVASLTARCRRLERHSERQRGMLEEVRVTVAKLEETVSKGQTELAYAQQQLEYVVVSLERERGIVADHTEQLRLFAGESRGRTGLDANRRSAKSMLLLLGSWLYMPVVHFAKGVYTLLAPIITTAQSLSLLNSEVLQRFTDDGVRARWGNARNGDLLVKLQRGTLDPPSVSGRKAASS